MNIDATKRLPGRWHVWTGINISTAICLYLAHHPDPPETVVVNTERRIDDTDAVAMHLHDIQLVQVHTVLLNDVYVGPIPD